MRRVKRKYTRHIKIDPVPFTTETVTASKSMIGTLTKCPNCKMEFRVMPSDGEPFFFTMKHPKE